MCLESIRKRNRMDTIRALKDLEKEWKEEKKRKK